MEEEFIRAELHGWIDEANSQQLHEIYELMIDNLNQRELHWDDLPEHVRTHILQSLAQAEAGLGRPFKEVTEEIRKKYKLGNNSDHLNPAP